MAVSTPPFFTDGKLGSVLGVFSVVPGDGRDNPPHLPGDTARATDGGHYIYVLAATAINAGDCVSIDKNANASQMTNALATAKLGSVGFCPANGGIPQGSYGWVALRSDDVAINVAAGTAAASALYTTAAAGVLSSTATSQVQIFGVVANAAAVAAGAVSAVVLNPRLVD